jgi:hypothetical protein
MTNTDFSSIFVANLEIDVANHICELVINNKLEWRAKIKKLTQSNKPSCAFWRRDVLAINPQYRQLAKDYILELSYIKKLLMTFHPRVVIDYVKDRNVQTFAYLKLTDQQACIYNLWKLQVDRVKEQRKNKKKAPVPKVTKVSHKKSPPNKMSGLL